MRARITQQENRAREVEERERHRVTREKAFDARWIGPGGVVAPEAGLIVLEEPPKDVVVAGGGTATTQNGTIIDLNLLVVLEQENHPGTLVESEVVGAGTNGGLLS